MCIDHESSQPCVIDAFSKKKGQEALGACLARNTSRCRVFKAVKPEGALSFCTRTLPGRTRLSLEMPCLPVDFEKALEYWLPKARAKQEHRLAVTQSGTVLREVVTVGCTSSYHLKCRAPLKLCCTPDRPHPLVLVWKYLMLRVPWLRRKKCSPVGEQVILFNSW